MAVESSFVMNLGAEGVERLDSGADALERLGNQIKTDRAELGAMQAALKNLMGSADVSGDTIDKLKDKIAIHKIVIAEAQSKYIEFGGTFQATSKKSDEAAGSLARAIDPVRAELDSLAKAELAKKLPADLNSLKAAMQASQQEANRLRESIKALGPETVANESIMKRLTGEARTQEARIGVLGARFAQLGGDLSTVRNKTESTLTPQKTFIQRLVDTSRNSGVASGGIGRLSGQMGSMSTLMKAGLIGGMLALGAAIVAVAAAAISAAAAFTVWSLKASNARRELNLSLAGMIAANRRIPTQVDTWQQLSDTLGGIAFKYKTTTAALQPLVTKLYEGGLRGRFLQQSLDLTTQAMLTGGDAAAATMASKVIAIGNVSKTLDRFGERWRKNMGTAALASAMTFGMQVDRLKQNLNGLVADVKLDGLAEKFSKLVDLFDRSSATGAGLRALFGSILQPLVGQAENGTVALTRFIKGAIIKALELRIAYLKVRNGIRDTFDGTVIGRILGANDGLTMLKATLISVAVLFSPIILGATILAAGMGLLVASVYLVGKGFLIAGRLAREGIDFILDKVKAVTDLIDANGWKGVGMMLVDGLVSGIKSAWTSAVSTVKDLGKQLLGAFKADNEIKSPSAKWAREAGEPIGQGPGVGIKRAAPSTVRAVTSLSEEMSAAFVAPKLQTSKAQAAATPVNVAVARAVQATAPATPRDQHRAKGAAGADQDRARRPSAGGFFRGGVAIESVVLKVVAAPGSDTKKLASELWDQFVEKMEEASAQSGQLGGSFG